MVLKQNIRLYKLRLVIGILFKLEDNIKHFAAESAGKPTVLQHSGLDDITGELSIEVRMYCTAHPFEDD